MTWKYYLLVAFALIVTEQVGAQALSSNFDQLEDYYRREQLLGNIEADYSFVSYPLFPVEAFGVKDPHRPNETTGSFFERDINELLGKSLPSDLSLKLLPLVWINQYNSHHPDGINDGAMIPARGYQTLINTGLYFQSKHISIKIHPEFVYAANDDFDGFPLERTTPGLAKARWDQYYYHFLHYIDLPEKFGETTYSKMLWGQSSIRVNVDPISLGFSNENLWWGPGIYNTLIMTNSAAGFAHFTLNTTSPVSTPIGSFEGQIVAGWLKNSKYPGPNVENVDHSWSPHYPPDPENERYLNGLIINFQPRWIPGLSFGLIRSFQIYHKDKGEEFIDYLPVFSSFSRKKLEEKDEPVKPYDFYNSIFFRFVWPESNVEFYGEFGRSDYFWDSRDLNLQLDHSAAYNMGFRKLLKLNKRENEYIEVGMELTQLAKSANSTLRTDGQWWQGWYKSNPVWQGYTHKGQLLGAGIGSGGNMQTLNISWHKNLNSLGVQLDRYVHNNDFHQENIIDPRMHWVDLSAALNGSWEYKNLLFTYTFKGVAVKNYQWVFDWSPEDYWDPSGANDIFNFHGQIGVMYRF